MLQVKSSIKSFNNTPEDIEKIPLNPGLYYLYNSSDTLMYVGRANSLRSKILEHRDINSCISKTSISWGKYKKEHSMESRKKLYEKAKQLSYDALSKPLPLVIDLIFDRVRIIEIEEMPSEKTQVRRIERILDWQPLYNHETACDEYYEIKGCYYDD